MDHRSSVLVVGIGSDHGDDRAGWLVVEQLQQMLATVPQDSRTEVSGVTTAVVRRALTPLDLLDWLESVDRLIICDAFEAASDDEAPICIRRCGGRWIEAGSGATIERLAKPGSVTGTHGIDVFDVLQLAEALGSLPGDVIIRGIAGECFAPDGDVSDGCRLSSKVVARLIFEDLCAGVPGTATQGCGQQALRDCIAGRFHA